MINSPYKICFLGYQKLSEMARKVIDSLHFQDTEVILLDSNYDTLPFVVSDALAQGCEVFIAGSSNAAEFKRRSYGHLVEIHVRTVDFLSAISRALQIGSRPAIVRYRYSAPIHMELLEQFSGCPVRVISTRTARSFMTCCARQTPLIPKPKPRNSSRNAAALCPKAQNPLRNRSSSKAPSHRICLWKTSAKVLFGAMLSSASKSCRSSSPQNL